MTLRPILFLLLLLTHWSAFAVVASIPPNPDHASLPISGWSFQTPTIYYETPELAAAPYCQQYGGVSGKIYVGDHYSVTCVNGGFISVYQYNNVCTAPSVLLAGMCHNYYCPTGYNLSANKTKCEPIPDGPCESKRSTYVNAYVGPVSDPSSISGYIDVCSSSCKATLANAAPKVSKSTGQIFLVGTWEYTGKSCNGEPTASTGNPDVNENPDPNSDDTITKSCADNPGGGHTTTYTITHSDGSKDFQYVTLAGSCSGANDDPNAEKDFCRENPTAPACKDFCADNPASCNERSTDGGGYCSAPPSCTGDEIDCASLFQQWATRCAFDSDAFTLPEAPPKTPAEMVADENKKVTDLLDNGAAVTIYNNFKLMDWSTWTPVFPVNTCAPFTGTVAGRSVSIDLCDKIAMLNELIGWLFAMFGAWTVVMTIYKKD